MCVPSLSWQTIVFRYENNCQFRTNLERTTFNFRTVVPPVALIEDCHGTWGEAAENERDGPNEPFAVAGQPVAFDAGKEEETVSVC